MQILFKIIRFFNTLFIQTDIYLDRGLIVTIKK